MQVLLITCDLEVEVAIPCHLFLQDLKLAQIQPDKKEIKRKLKTKETLGLCNKGVSASKLCLSMEIFKLF